MLHESEPRELSPRRQRTRAKRIERIVETAMQLIAEESFDGLTMTRLAAELDLTTGALYRYFASKDALVAELQARAIRAIEETLEARQAARPRPAGATGNLAQLLDMAAFYMELARKEPRLYRLVAATLADPRQLLDDAEASKVAPGLTTLLSGVATGFAAAQEAGALHAGNPLERTIIFWSSLHGVTLVGKLERLVPAAVDAAWFEARALGLELATTLLRGWGADDEDVDRARAWLTEPASGG